MKKILKHAFNSLPEEKHYPAKLFARRLKNILDWLSFWRWCYAPMPARANRQFAFYFFGRKAHLHMAADILGLEHPSTSAGKNKITVTEFPIPGYLKIPYYMKVILPLADRNPKELLTLMEKQKSKFLRNHRHEYRMHQVTEDHEIHHIRRNILEPFAAHRFGNHVYHLTDVEVQEMAKKTGRLHLVYHEHELVACHVGTAYIAKQKRYWNGARSGHPKTIYEDSQRLRKANLMNTFMEIEWAHANGYDYYDFGATLAQPENGALQWKRAFRGDARIPDDTAYFYIKPPHLSEAHFFWDVPLFSVEKKHLVLHVGMPSDVDSETFMNRLKLLNFGSISKMYIHANTPPLPNFEDDFKKLYAHSKPPKYQWLMTQAQLFVFCQSELLSTSMNWLNLLAI